MSDIELKNAKITHTSLGYEDHGIFTCCLHLDYGGSCQGFGNVALDRYDDTLKRRVGSACGTEFVARVLKTVGVSRWEDLPGKHIRVKADHSKVRAIGNIIEEKWFTPATDLSGFLKD